MRRVGSACVLAVAMFAATATVHAQWTAQQWLDRLEQRTAGRLHRVEQHYVEELKPKGVLGAVMGEPGLYASGETAVIDGKPRCVANCRVFEVVETTDPVTGETKKTGHLLSPTEVAVRGGFSPSSYMLDAMGTGYAIMQDSINAGVHDSPAAGAIEAIFGDVEDTEVVIHDAEERSWEEDERETPWLNPFRLFGASAGMMFETADHVAEAEMSHLKSAEQVQAERQQLQALKQSATTVGVESVGDRSGMHVAVDLGSLGGGSFAYEGTTYAFTDAGIWIDTDEHVVLKHRVEGTATANGETREFFIETVHSDFREPEGCEGMFEPYRRTMRMGGMIELDEKQKAELQKAQAQLAEFEKQLAEMPADQREMAMNMMGGQMQQMKALTSGGAIEHVEEIDAILCDPDLKSLFTVQIPEVDLAAIQRKLVELGYEPGNTDGVLDTMTRVAISQFQAESGMPVTGEPSFELAAALDAVPG